MDQLPPVALAAVPATKNQRSGENARDIFTKSFTTILSCLQRGWLSPATRDGSRRRRGEERSAFVMTSSSSLPKELIFAAIFAAKLRWWVPNAMTLDFYCRENGSS